MARKIVVLADQLRDDDYAMLRQAWQEALLRDQLAREAGMKSPTRRRINWPLMMTMAIGLVAAAGLCAVLVK